MIVRYKTADKSYANGRIDYYSDENGVIIAVGPPGQVGFQVLGCSLGYDYALQPNALFRVEGKEYASQTPIFEGKRLDTALTTSLAVSF